MRPNEAQERFDAASAAHAAARAERPAMAVYVISVAAELAGVHPQTLRIYERKGLLDPARTVRREPALQRARTSPSCAASRT